MKGLLLCALALAFATVTTHAQLQYCEKRCGKQADGMECPNNLCCSKDGYCGLGVDYCSAAAGCQSGACYDNKMCGTQADGALCPNNHCCSSGGRCGYGREYCSGGCQSGTCWADVKCGHLDNGELCPNNFCCSQYGYCGLGPEFCGSGCQNGACSTDSGLGRGWLRLRYCSDISKVWHCSAL